MDNIQETRDLEENQIPYFSWDRRLSAKDIKEKLSSDNRKERVKTYAWIMREAAFRDVWAFLSPYKVWEEFEDIEPMLGKKREFWRFILEKWHELGKI